MSNTFLVAEAREEVPWTKPEDVAVGPKKPLPKLGVSGGVPDVVQVLLCDGSVRTVNTKKTSEKTLRNAITRNDGQPLGADW